MSKDIQDIIENMKNSDKVCGLICLPVLKVSNLELEEFGQFDYIGDNMLDGVNAKGFYRISTDSFENAIREIKNNPNSSIVTCYNDAFKEGEHPKKISAMIKYTLVNDQPDALITSLLNYYGVPTTLNLKAINDIDLEFPIDGDEVRPMEYVSPDKVMISIDALKEDEEFYNFDELNIPINSFLFDSILSETTTFLTKLFNREPFDKLSQTKKDEIFLKVRDQLAMSYLIRKHLCADADFGARNLGLVLNKKTLDVNFVNFDYEFSFRARSFFSFDTIKDMLANAPEAYNRFINLSEKLAHDLHDEGVLFYQDRMEMANNLQCSSNQLLEVYNNLKMILSKDMEYKIKMGMIDDKVK